MLSDQVGGQIVANMAEVNGYFGLDGLVPDMVTFGGGGLGAATTRPSKFLEALSNYDILLSKYQDLNNHRAAPATLIKAEADLKKAFQ